MTDEPTIELRPLRDEEFVSYRERSVPAYAEELVRARGADLEAAIRNAEESFPASLQAVTEEGQWIFRVTAEGADVGWLWIAPAPLGGDGLFIYDWNHRAEALYRSLGYEVMSTQMRKTLDGGR